MRGLAKKDALPRSSGRLLVGALLFSVPPPRLLAPVVFGVFLALAPATTCLEAQETSPHPPDTIRILVYNTHHGEGMDGVLDLERIANLISSVGPDVVALQEMDSVVDRTGDVDQAGTYGDLAGMEPFFGDFMEYGGGRYGMALLSRLPMREETNHRLPTGAEPRTSVSARIDLQGSGRELVVAGIHFYRTEEERLAQARRVMEIFAKEEAPVILAGDFNSLPGSPVMELLAQEWDVPAKEGSPFTFPADDPAREIDFILLRPGNRFRVLEYRVLDEPVASDHRPILMVVELR
jgi:endonuclease/exonuclease/phosphatase family metal-dependent hydrolase